MTRLSTNTLSASINWLSTAIDGPYDCEMQLTIPTQRPSAPPSRRQSNLRLALLFWAFTYALFTYRANLRYGDEYELISAIRLISTMVGAALYWLVLSRLVDDRPGKPIAVIATILPASVVVLLARVVLDQMGAVNPNGFAGDLRFVMVWGGYFGLWVSVSLLLRTMPGAVPERHLPSTVQRPVERTAAQVPTSIPTAAISLDRLAIEIGRLPESDRNRLIERFAVAASYEAADAYDRG